MNQLPPLPRPEPLKMTMKVWKRTHRDYKCIVGGRRFAMVLHPDTGATYLAPVEILKEQKETQA